MTVVAKRRPTQAERSAETQARVLTAVVRCLHMYGYSVTTTSLVAKEAGISRGAMLHQFPTKTELMLFVVRSVFDDTVSRHNKHLESSKHSDSELLEVLWKTLSRPSAIAVLEILLGCRSDRLLMGKLAILQEQIERESVQIATRFHPGAGTIETLTEVRLITWTMRGLSVANLFADNSREVIEMMDLLRRMMTAYRKATPPR